MGFSDWSLRCFQCRHFCFGSCLRLWMCNFGRRSRGGRRAKEFFFQGAQVVQIVRSHFASLGTFLGDWMDGLLGLGVNFRYFFCSGSSFRYRSFQLKLSVYFGSFFCKRCFKFVRGFDFGRDL